jgi:hypothetical protein
LAGGGPDIEGDAPFIGVEVEEEAALLGVGDIAGERAYTPGISVPRSRTLTSARATSGTEHLLYAG